MPSALPEPACTQPWREECWHNAAEQVSRSSQEHDDTSPARLGACTCYHRRRLRFRSASAWGGPWSPASGPRQRASLRQAARWRKCGRRRRLPRWVDLGVALILEEDASLPGPPLCTWALNTGVQLSDSVALSHTHTHVWRMNRRPYDVSTHPREIYKHTRAQHAITPRKDSQTTSCGHCIRAERPTAAYTDTRTRHNM